MTNDPSTTEMSILAVALLKNPEVGVSKIDRLPVGSYLKALNFSWVCASFELSFGSI